MVGTECLVMIEVKVTSLSESMRDSRRNIYWSITALPFAFQCSLVFLLIGLKI